MLSCVVLELPQSAQDVPVLWALVGMLVLQTEFQLMFCPCQRMDMLKGESTI